MKTLLIIILGCFLLPITIYSQQKVEVNLIAKVTKIDSTKNNFIVYIKSKSGHGIFSIPKICNDQRSYKFKLTKGKLYSFKLKEDVHKHMPENLTKELIETELVDDQLIWTSKMHSTFYEDCANMCGLYIDNEGKPKKCKTKK